MGVSIDPVLPIFWDPHMIKHLKVFTTISISVNIDILAKSGVHIILNLI